jgi:hypothetical protein
MLAEFAWRANAGETAEALLDEAHEFRHGLEQHWFESEVDALFTSAPAQDAVQEVMQRNTEAHATIAADPEAQWRLRRESLGLLSTLTQQTPADFLADMRIAAARERRIAREGK